MGVVGWLCVCVSTSICMCNFVPSWSLMPPVSQASTTLFALIIRRDLMRNARSWLGRVVDTTLIIHWPRTRIKHWCRTVVWNVALFCALYLFLSAQHVTFFTCFALFCHSLMGIHHRDSHISHVFFPLSFTKPETIFSLKHKKYIRIFVYILYYSALQLTTADKIISKLRDIFTCIFIALIAVWNFRLDNLS